ncbi:unnamed protein product, partial [Rotaria socialis]
YLNELKPVPKLLFLSNYQLYIDATQLDQYRFQGIVDIDAHVRQLEHNQKINSTPLKKVQFLFYVLPLFTWSFPHRPLFATKQQQQQLILNFIKHEGWRINVRADKFQCF